MLSVLRHPVYRSLFAAQVLSLIGTGLTTVALALLAYELAGHPMPVPCWAPPRDELCADAKERFGADITAHKLVQRSDKSARYREHTAYREAVRQHVRQAA